MPRLWSPSPGLQVSAGSWGWNEKLWFLLSRNSERTNIQVFLHQIRSTCRACRVTKHEHSPHSPHVCLDLFEDVVVPSHDPSCNFRNAFGLCSRETRKVNVMWMGWGGPPVCVHAPALV